MKEGPSHNSSRRGFLKAVGILAAGAGASLIIGKIMENIDDPLEDVWEPPKENVEAKPKPHISTVETNKKPEIASMHDLLASQLRSGNKITFDRAQQKALNDSWLARMKHHSFTESLVDGHERINVKSETNPDATYLELIKHEFEKEGVKSNFLYICFSESWFTLREKDGRPMISPTGAVGPFQFQLGAGADYGLVSAAKDKHGNTTYQRDESGKLLWDHRNDPVEAGRATAQYVKRFASRFMAKGTPENEAWDLAVLCFNGGFAQTYLKVAEKPTMDGFREFITKEMNAALERTKKDWEREVRSGETLESLSKRFGVTEGLMQQYNPDVNWKNLVAHQTKILVPGTETAPLYKEFNGQQVEVSKDSAEYKNYALKRKLQILSGYIENLDYLPKTKSIVYMVDNYDLARKVPLPRPRPKSAPQPPRVPVPKPRPQGLG